MKHRKNTLYIALTLALAGTMPLTAHAINLPATGYVTYGDANSYALNIQGLQVLSGPGQIDVYAKLGLNPPGQLPNSIPGMDDAFMTPTANNIDGFRMDTAGSNEPGGTTSLESWDRLGWWDSTLSALNNKLDIVQNSLVFFFANNETGNTPDLAGWARIELTQISTGIKLGTWDLTNNSATTYGPPPLGGGVPNGDPGAYTSTGAEPVVEDFIDSGNDICTDGSGNLVSCLGPYTNIYHENLGGDRAAYAIVFPELNAEIASLNALNFDDYAIHINYRLGCGPELTKAGTGSGDLGGFPTYDGPGNKTPCAENYALNGGDEKVFIGTSAAISQIPEPSSTLLTGLALLALGMVRRRLNR